MCGIVGFTNYNGNMNFEEADKIITNMNEKLSRRGPDEKGIYKNNNIYLGHRRLVVIDKEHGKQPMCFKFQGNNYVMVYNGQLYNYRDLQEELGKAGFNFEGHSDTEVLLKAFVYWGYDVVKHLNGMYAFAIWDENKSELFMARDHLGIKPLFYAVKNGEIIFASEIKALFEFPSLYPCIDENGISELFGIGPAHTQGTTVFKGIEELKPANFLIFRKNQKIIKKYWKLTSKMHTDDFETTCAKTKYLLKKAIERQLMSDVPLCTFLSGGLDSSIISMYAQQYYKEKGLAPLETYSVDYKDNDKNFDKTDFQPNTDSDYVGFISKKLGTNHHIVMLDTPELAESLKDAVIARDTPGMADVDPSILLFCKKVNDHATVALTGECADEIFGGYPWFFRKDALDSNTFPWSINISGRQHLLNPEIEKRIDLKSYIDYRYNESLKEVEILDADTEETKQKRKISYLTFNWFMNTLLDRSDRMAMYNGFELRVPFGDYELAEYVWNIPWEMKAYKGREKGLLRHIMKDKLPKEIVERKKSPYPKTWNPNYLQTVKKELINIMQNPNSPIRYLLNKKDINEIIKTDGKFFSRPWFGQLMTGPQLMAYLIQVNLWLEIYKPLIEIN